MSSSGDLLQMDPVPTLLTRIAAELGADFLPSRPTRVSRAPGRLDVMGGIADYTGSTVCEATLDRAAAVALQERDDRELQIFSFNLYDDHVPFTLRMPLSGLASASVDSLRADFSQPGRKFAGYLAGCLFLLHEQRFIDLNDPRMKGINLALYSTVPIGAGVSSSAAIEVATMLNLRDHFNIASKLDPMKLAALCQQVENRIVGAPCGIMDQVTSCAGQVDSLLRLRCQPHELLPPLKMPNGIRAVGIDSNVKHSVGGGAYGRTRCAAFMGHRMILEKMRDLGRAAGKELHDDPMHGYLANLAPDDYKKYFRPFLPESMKGADFLSNYGATTDTVTTVDANANYNVLGATDHHVLEASRVRRFIEFLEQAGSMNPDHPDRTKILDKAGHLMYASHLSYTNDAQLGADECDLLVDLVCAREHDGFYGAKITGGGSGGTVAILADAGERTDAAIAQIMSDYASRTGRKPQAFLHSSPGAWQTGTALA